MKTARKNTVENDMCVMRVCVCVRLFAFSFFLVSVSKVVNICFG